VRAKQRESTHGDPKVIPSTIDAWVAPPALPRPLAEQELLVSPELALVDDELRGDAIALLPEVRPYEFLDRLRAAAVREPDWLVAEPSFEQWLPPRRTTLGVAIAAYLATAVVRTLAFNVVVFACIALIVLVVNLAA
jgi:hypothetical protein